MRKSLQININLTSLEQLEMTLKRLDAPNRDSSMYIPGDAKITITVTL